MVRSVKITTPIPSLEEFGKALGISKARQKSLMQIILGDDSDNSASRQRRNVTDNRKKRKSTAASNGRGRVAAKAR
jgi:hypothetical protein